MATPWNSSFTSPRSHRARAVRRAGELVAQIKKAAGMLGRRADATSVGTCQPLWPRFGVANARPLVQIQLNNPAIGWMLVQ